MAGSRRRVARRRLAAEGVCSVDGASSSSNGDLCRADCFSPAEYAWNARNQLAEITGPTTASFAYHPFGRRIEKTLGGKTTKVLFDGANAVQETLGSAPTVNLLTGLSVDKTYTRTTSEGAEDLLTDALGSTIALAGSTAKVETSYT